MVIPKHQVDDLPLKAVNKKRKLKKWVIILLCLIGLIGMIILADIYLENIYKNDSYSKEFENNFIASCKAQGSTSSDCECIYKLLKQDYSFEQSNNFDADPQSILAKQALDTIVGKCKRR